MAPAAPKQRYAVDSQQTKLIRWLAPHFEHRLFLSATPHNGYPESFTALLEIIDDLRFVRGVDPDPVAQRETVIRRMKSQITDAAGNPRFPKREARAIAVTYPESEREAHALLDEFAALRRRRLTTRRGRASVDLVTLLLKKRLFSSPARVRAHRRRLPGNRPGEDQEAGTSHEDEVPEWLEGFFDDVAAYDDEELADAEDDATARSGKIQAELTDTSEQEISLLQRMETWAARYENSPDAKAKELIAYLKAVCLPDGKHWTNERVVVFTEYRDTQIWLKDLLAQEGHGRGAGAAAVRRHGAPGGASSCGWRSQAPPTRTRCASCSPPTPPARASTCTSTATGWSTTTSPSTRTSWSSASAASTGTASRQTPEVRHFIGTGWEIEPATPTRPTWSSWRGSRSRSRGWKRTSARSTRSSPRRCSAGCSARSPTSTSRTRPPPPSGPRRTGGSPPTANVSEQVKRLRRDLDATVEELKVTPDHVKRLVDTALELDGEQPLRPVIDEKQLAEGLYEVPALTKSWARATEGLLEKLEREGEEPRRRPVTFDAGDREGTARHRARPPRPPARGHVRAAAARRRVERAHRPAPGDRRRQRRPGRSSRRWPARTPGSSLVGKDGIRLHEEILYAGGWLREDGTFRRVDSLSAVSGMLDRALTAARPPRRSSRRGWPRSGRRARTGLITAIERRTDERLASLHGQAGRPPGSRTPRDHHQRRPLRGHPAPGAGGERRRRKTRCSAWSKDAATSGRSPSGAGTGRTGRSSSTAWTAKRDRELARVASRYERDHAAQLPGRGDLRRAPPGGDPMSPRPRHSRRFPADRAGAHRVAQADRRQRPVPVRARAHRRMAGPGAAGRRGARQAAPGARPLAGQRRP